MSAQWEGSPASRTEGLRQPCINQLAVSMCINEVTAIFWQATHIYCFAQGKAYSQAFWSPLLEFLIELWNLSTLSIMFETFQTPMEVNKRQLFKNLWSLYVENTQASLLSLLKYTYNLLLSDYSTVLPNIVCYSPNPRAPLCSLTTLSLLSALVSFL